MAVFLATIGVTQELLLAAIPLLFAGFLADILTQIPSLSALLGLFGCLNRQGHRQGTADQQG